MKLNFFCIKLQGYLKSLGMARTAEVKRDARIGEAEARADAQIKEAIAEEQRMAARFLNDTEIAKAQRDFELKKAAYDVEVQTKKAEAEMGKKSSLNKCFFFSLFLDYFYTKNNAFKSYFSEYWKG